MEGDEGKSGLSSSQSSIDSGSSGFEYSRSSFEGNSPDSVVEEIAGEGVVESYQYKPLEAEGSHSPRDLTDDEAQDAERLHNFNRLVSLIMMRLLHHEQSSLVY